MDEFEATRRSWNYATRQHNWHKGDQAARLRGGEELLFAEELELLGDIAGKHLLHLQCNAGQDSLCLARRGARVTGVDLSDEAIEFARQLSVQCGLHAQFERAEALQWLDETPQRFDLVFSSYGAVGWLPDLDGWARGIARVLRPGGRFVYVEFHPIRWSVGDDLRLSGDDYFTTIPFQEPVSDYVASSGASLGAQDQARSAADAPPAANRFAAYSYQHGLAQIVEALLRAGMQLETLREYPYANGCKIHPELVEAPDRRWVWPDGVARTPLMFGLAARR